MKQLIVWYDQFMFVHMLKYFIIFFEAREGEPLLCRCHWDIITSIVGHKKLWAKSTCYRFIDFQVPPAIASGMH